MRQSTEAIDKVFTSISTVIHNSKLIILLIEKHIYIYYSLKLILTFILMFVYVVLKPKFLRVKWLVFHKFFIFVSALDFIND